MLRRTLPTALLVALLPLNAMAAEPTIHKLALGESLQLPGSAVSLRFVDFEDHRCPVDVRCISAGYAKVFLEIDGGKEPRRTLELPWQTDAPPPLHELGAPAIVAGRRIALQSLEPRPRAKAPVDRNSYVATVIVEAPRR